MAVRAAAGGTVSRKVSSDSNASAIRSRSASAGASVPRVAKYSRAFALAASIVSGLMGSPFYGRASAGRAPAPRRPAARTSSLWARLGRPGPSPARACGAHFHRQVARDGLAAESRRLGDAERGGIERQLQGNAVDQTEDHRGRPQNVGAAEDAGPHPLRHHGSDRSPHAIVEGGVDHAKAAVVHHLAPELDEHDPAGALLDGELQTRFDQYPEPGPRVPRPAGLGGGDPTIEIGRDRLECGDQDRALVGEVIVENALAQAGLPRDLLHGEAGVAVAGETSDGRAHDLGAPKRRDAASGAHAGPPVT